MENFVILVRLPTNWPTQPAKDGGRTPQQPRSPLKTIEEVIDSQGGRVTTSVALEGRYDFLAICEMPNHEAVLKVAFQLGQQGYKTETSVAIDSGIVEHAWSSVQQQLATAGR